MGLFNFFKPEWTSRDVGKALKAVEKETNQKKLAKIAKKRVLASTKPDDIVFDPFNGGGTTGIACIIFCSSGRLTKLTEWSASGISKIRGMSLNDNL